MAFLRVACRSMRWACRCTSETAFPPDSRKTFGASYNTEPAYYGAISGILNRDFCPEDGVLREHLAKFLLRLEHGASWAPPAIVERHFSDVAYDGGDAESEFAPFIEHLRAEGI